MQDVAPIIVGVGIIVFLAHLFAGIFNRIRIPDVLFLIALGIFVGPISHMINVSNIGDIGYVFSTITLIIILFEYGTTLELNALRHSVAGAFKLAFITFTITMAFVTGIILLLTDLDILTCLITAAIISSTSEAIVIPLVKQLNIKDISQAFLSVESTITAVLSIIVTLTLIETYKIGQFQILHLSGNLVASFFVAICLAVGGAYLWQIILNKMRNLKNTMFTTVAFVFVIFGIVEMLGFNGAIAALVFGITLSNIKSIHFPFLKNSTLNESSGLTEMEKTFFSEIAFLLKTFFFVYLGMSLQLISSTLIILASLLTVIIFVLRVISSKLSLNKTFTSKDSTFISIMIPRGLTAIILASIPIQQGMQGGDTIKNVTYGVVLFSIVLTSILVLLVEKTKFCTLFNLIFKSDSKEQKSNKEVVNN